MVEPDDPRSASSTDVRWKVSVVEPSKQDNGIRSYISYTVESEMRRHNYAKSYSVKRRYRDFVWLRKELIATYSPGEETFMGCSGGGQDGEYVIPPLPDKKLYGHFDEHFVERRRKGLEGFLKRIVETMPAVAQCEHMKVFLRASYPTWIEWTRKSAEENIRQKLMETFESPKPMPVTPTLLPPGLGLDHRVAGESEEQLTRAGPAFDEGDYRDLVEDSVDQTIDIDALLEAQVEASELKAKLINNKRQKSVLKKAVRKLSEDLKAMEQERDGLRQQVQQLRLSSPAEESVAVGQPLPAEPENSSGKLSVPSRESDNGNHSLGAIKELLTLCLTNFGKIASVMEVVEQGDGMKTHKDVLTGRGRGHLEQMHAEAKELLQLVEDTEERISNEILLTQQLEYFAHLFLKPDLDLVLKWTGQSEQGAEAVNRVLVEVGEAIHQVDPVRVHSLGVTSDKFAELVCLLASAKVQQVQHTHPFPKALGRMVGDVCKSIRNSAAEASGTSTTATPTATPAVAAAAAAATTTTPTALGAPVREAENESYFSRGEDVTARLLPMLFPGFDSTLVHISAQQRNNGGEKHNGVLPSDMHGTVHSQTVAVDSSHRMTYGVGPATLKKSYSAPLHSYVASGRPVSTPSAARVKQQVQQGKDDRPLSPPLMA